MLQRFQAFLGATVHKLEHPVTAAPVSRSRLLLREMSEHPSEGKDGRGGGGPSLEAAAHPRQHAYPAHVYAFYLLNAALQRERGPHTGKAALGAEMGK